MKAVFERTRSYKSVVVGPVREYTIKVGPVHLFAVVARVVIRDGIRVSFINLDDTLGDLLIEVDPDQGKLPELKRWLKEALQHLPEDTPAAEVEYRLRHWAAGEDLPLTLAPTGFHPRQCSLADWWHKDGIMSAVPAHFMLLDPEKRIFERQKTHAPYAFLYGKKVPARKKWEQFIAARTDLLTPEAYFSSGVGWPPVVRFRESGALVNAYYKAMVEHFHPGGAWYGDYDDRDDPLQYRVNGATVALVMPTR